MWNPDVYLAFADHRGRPFFDLVSRVSADSRDRHVDLGCGPGNLTVHARARWPDAVIEAVDSSPEMVAAARGSGLEASVGGVEEWSAEAGHRRRGLQRGPAVGARGIRSRRALGRCTARRGHGSAMPVPGDFDAPSHQAVREGVAQQMPGSGALRDMPWRDETTSSMPAFPGTPDVLTDAGCTWTHGRPRMSIESTRATTVAGLDHGHGAAEPGEEPIRRMMQVGSGSGRQSCGCWQGPIRCGQERRHVLQVPPRLRRRTRAVSLCLQHLDHLATSSSMSAPGGVEHQIGSSGGSYGASTPVRPLSSPARARA